jgi:predicted metal-dependent enzyme (double-stranded beta helix superfamily)
MFDLDGFLADLVSCSSETDARRAAKEVVDRAMTTPDRVADVLAPTAGGLRLLHHAGDLTVINVAWAPGMRLMPHDHRMWAVIGIYAGTEDNHFYRRGSTSEIVETTGRRLDAGDVCVLGTDAIHSVENPAPRITGAIHVYGGDFVNEPRSQWGPGDLIERPYDLDEVNRLFREANLAAGLPTT